MRDLARKCPKENANAALLAQRLAGRRQVTTILDADNLLADVSEAVILPAGIPL
ncbi:hypothetical protein [Maioricimonas rarisocia]|uniref:hypothetical protein n=1 Tax=Maioricimonas rarisocia TaxID=2528026 RepID=UPI0018D2071A|nr:hypothetical protein [Maioricimonas rarisocia]